jgi:Co/Zn/Cd efflux system component
MGVQMGYGVMTNSLGLISDGGLFSSEPYLDVLG